MTFELAASAISADITTHALTAIDSKGYDLRLYHFTPRTPMTRRIEAAHLRDKFGCLGNRGPFAVLGGVRQLRRPGALLQQKIRLFCCGFALAGITCCIDIGRRSHAQQKERGDLMKRIVTAVMVVLAMVSLAGCGAYGKGKAPAPVVTNG